MPEESVFASSIYTTILKRALLIVACLYVAPAAQGAEGIHKIEHVVTIMQENRSFDDYFGTYPGANGIPAGVCVPDPVNGGCQHPFHDPYFVNDIAPHTASAATGDIAKGAMNGFVAQQERYIGCRAGEPRCLPCYQRTTNNCIDAMGYHDAREIPNYWEYAKHFVLQDNLFASDASWSFPTHLSLVSGWSASCPTGDANPLDCTSNLYPHIEEASHATWTDITYLLHKYGVSWRYYVLEGLIPDCQLDEEVVCEEPTVQTPRTPGIWNPLRGFADVRADEQLGNIQALPKFYEAVHAEPQCGLPNVAWLVPNRAVSEHPGDGPLRRGQAYVTTLVNAIMRSPCWASTAIFLSWDEWGGLYDHVVPQRVDADGYGLRVPGLVISPYARAGFVDHQKLTHDNYLKFIEDNFLGGARLNPATDGRPDSRPDVREENPQLGDLTSDFDFTQVPQPPLILPPRPAPGPASEPPK
jgi:phospholipase C